MSLTERFYKQTEAKNIHNTLKSLEYWEEIGQRDQTIFFHVFLSQTPKKHQKTMLSDVFSGNKDGNIGKKWFSIPFFLYVLKNPQNITVTIFGHRVPLMIKWPLKLYILNNNNKNNFSVFFFSIFLSSK